MINDVFSTLLQSLIALAVLFLLTRLIGKKQLSQLTFLDYVAGISIGTIAGSFAIDSSIGYARGITGLIIFAAFPLVLSFISLKSNKARKLLEGKPAVLVQNGRLVEKNLRKTQLTVNEVLQECRLKNAFNIADVEFAILETDGKMSVELKSPNQPLTPKDMNIAAGYKGLCVNVIVDGEILEDKLTESGRDHSWLEDELKKQNVTDKKDVLLAYIDSNNVLNLQKKNDIDPENPLM